MVLVEEIKAHSDVGLVQECQRGDPAAFRELVRRYMDRVCNVAYRFLGNHEDAQDIAQETFVRAYRGIQTFKGDAKVYTWLYSIAGNLARNKLRDSKRKGRDKGTSFEAMEERGGPVASGEERSPESAARQAELDEILQACLDELPEHYRMAFVLRTFDDLGYGEIADAMGCPVGTVKSRLNQARKLLRNRLRELNVL